MVVDIKVSQGLDSLILIPRVASESLRVLTALEEAMPDIDFRQMVQGYEVRERQAPRLHSELQTLDLRWDEAARRFLENRIVANSNHRGAVIELQRLLEGGLPIAEELLSDVLNGLGVLDAHQIENVAAMTLPRSPGLCVFDEQGAGKTVSTIFAYDTLVSRDEVDFLLIIAPKSMVPEWPNDFQRFRGDLYSVATMTGSRRQKRETLTKLPDVLVAGFEAAINLEPELIALLRHYNGRSIIAVDESFFIKNQLAQRTRTVKRLREWCNRAFVLCGTPAPNSAHDLIQQFSFVDFGQTFSDVAISKEREEAHNQVRSVIENGALYVRHLKRDVLPDLPAKAFRRVMLTMQQDQQRRYLALLEGYVHDLRSASDEEYAQTRVSFMAKRSRLLQTCSHPGAVFDDYTEVPSKLLALDELLREAIETKNEKVVVWSFYTFALDTIYRRYAKYNPVRYDGSVTDVAVRRAGVKAFQEDVSVMLFVGNPAAAGAGLTLHSARLAVYESFSNQAAHYMQSLDRIHRRGQSRKVEYAILLCNDTLEMSEYERLVSKEAASADLLGDPADLAITRQQDLAEALTSLAALNLNQETSVG